IYYHLRISETEALRFKKHLEVISREVHDIINQQYQTLNEHILPGLRSEGVAFIHRSELTPELAAWVHDYFINEVMPVLTPIGLDPAHPFPRVINKSLNFAVELQGCDAFGREANIAIVQAPRSLPRVIRLPEHLCERKDSFIMLSSVLHAHVDELFPGMAVLGCYQFRITRNADLFLDEEEIKDLRDTLKDELQQRYYGDAVRLETADNCSEEVAQYLLKHFHLDAADLYRVPGMVNLVRLMEVVNQIDRPHLKYTPFVPGTPPLLERNPCIFDAIAQHDILLNHPFQSFAPVVNLLSAAADDPCVVAVKMTIYRTGTDSILMQHLIRAAQQGKEVTVVLELMARFDEEANISWASLLEKAGAHVVYGVFGYKTHAKMLMLVRRENDRLRRYVHLSTGNYHSRTSRLYTDYGLLTCNEEIGADVFNVFQQLTGLGKVNKTHHLWQAPFDLHTNIINAIERERENATLGGKARIIAKMNSLVEPKIIEALYSASQAGVKIDLIVRGACALRPGVSGLSDNIRVISIVGRFLEHPRIFYFYAGGKETVYLSSADWMGRNFFKRIEIAFPILDPKLKRRVIKEGLRIYLEDNTQSWEMRSDGTYKRKVARKNHLSAQDELLTKFRA
ncbi:MAG: polyphosphate kinase 1, partial [Saezia sp.]